MGGGGGHTKIQPIQTVKNENYINLNLLLTRIITV